MIPPTNANAMTAPTRLSSATAMVGKLQSGFTAELRPKTISFTTAKRCALVSYHIMVFQGDAPRRRATGGTRPTYHRSHAWLRTNRLFPLVEGEQAWDATGRLQRADPFPLYPSARTGGPSPPPGKQFWWGGRGREGRASKGFRPQTAPPHPMVRNPSAKHTANLRPRPFAPHSTSRLAHAHRPACLAPKPAAKAPPLDRARR